MKPTMHIPKLLAAALLTTASSTFAAAPAYLVTDFSTEALMGKDQALGIWKAQVDDKLVKRLNKLYPVSKWGFVSQVEGGFTTDKTCVVTARAMMLPRSGKALQFKPAKSATAFDAKAGATIDDCKALASAKLTEAIDAVASSLLAR
jgi:hypothetical protein